MERVPVPSLQFCASMKVMTTLFALPRVLRVVADSSRNFIVSHETLVRVRNADDPRDPFEIFDVLIGLVRQLPLLTPALAHRLLCWTEPIEFQLVCWHGHFQKFLLPETLPPTANVLRRVRWTPDGRVDCERTVDALIADPDFRSHDPRLQRACTSYKELEKLSPWSRRFCNTSLSVVRQKLGDFGSGFLEEEDAQEWRNGAVQCVVSGNEQRLKACWQKIPCSGVGARQRMAKLLAYVAVFPPESSAFYLKEQTRFSRSSHTEILRFLLAHATDADKSELLRTDVRVSGRSRVLPRFLEWPFQGSLMALVRLAWDFLPPEDFLALLDAVVEKFPREEKAMLEEFPYRSLFRDLWEESPTCLKEFVWTECHAWLASLLVNRAFVCQNGGANIRWLLKPMSLEVRRKFFDAEGQAVCRELRTAQEWTVLEVFITECLADPTFRSRTIA